MLPLLPSHAHNELAGSFIRTPRVSDPDGFINPSESLPPDPLFMALRAFADRITSRFRRSDPEAAITPPKAPAGMPVIDHPACHSDSSDRIAA